MIRLLISILILSCACGNLQAQEYFIKTIAGIDTFGFAGDGGPAIDCELWKPEAVYIDKFKNVYISDLDNGRIRKIDIATGIITTVVGGGTGSSVGDNGPATNAELYEPTDVTTDSVGNIYIADGFNYRVRKVEAATGIIYTVAGNGSTGYSGDGEQATNAQLSGPSGVCVDKLGNIFIADYYNNVLRKVDAHTGIITTIAGTGSYGYTGDNGPATNATFNGVVKVFVDSFEEVYVSDQFNGVIRKIDADGIITTVAGNGTTGYSGDGSLAINAELSQPSGLYVDKGKNIFFAEYGNGVVRKVAGTTGVISTLAGNGTLGFSGDDGPATNAQLRPGGLCLDGSGIIYVADMDNNRIRVLYSPLAVSPSPAIPDIAIYPNPVSCVLNIEHAKGYHLSLSNILGTEVLSALIASDKSEVDVSSLPAGVYLARFSDEFGNTVTEKIVKE